MWRRKKRAVNSVPNHLSITQHINHSPSNPDYPVFSYEDWYFSLRSKLISGLSNAHLVKRGLRSFNFQSAVYSKKATIKTL